MGTYRLDDLVDQLLRLVDLFFGVCHDQAVQIFFLVTGVSSIRSSFPFLDGAFSTDCNLRLGLGFHFLERVATRSDE